MAKGKNSRQNAQLRWLALVLIAGVVAAGAGIWFTQRSTAPKPAAPEPSASGAAAPTRTIHAPTEGTAAGSPSASLTIEIYSDFQCPYCKVLAEQTLPPLIRDYVETGRVRLVYRFFPIIGSESQQAAAAAFCAAQQGKFWPYHDLLFANQKGEQVGSFTPQNLKRMAEQAGLDVTAWQGCLGQPATTQRIQQDVAAGQRYGVQGTPTLILIPRGGTPVVLKGAYPYEALKPYIDQLLGGSR